jgi:hypothetical protein
MWWPRPQPGVAQAAQCQLTKLLQLELVLKCEASETYIPPSYCILPKKELMGENATLTTYGNGKLFTIQRVTKYLNKPKRTGTARPF